MRYVLSSAYDSKIEETVDPDSNTKKRLRNSDYFVCVFKMTSSGEIDP